MKTKHLNESKLDTLTDTEIAQVAGGSRYGTVGIGEDGRYEIVSTTSKSPLYFKFSGKWVPIGTEPFIGPAASELGI